MGAEVTTVGAEAISSQARLAQATRGGVRGARSSPCEAAPVAIGVDSRLEGVDSGLDLAVKARGPADRDSVGRGVDEHNLQQNCA
jgi:hypothetical protein